MELDDACLASLHENLVERYVTSSVPGRTAFMVSPPPPANLLQDACASHVPYITSIEPNIYENMNGTYAGMGGGSVRSVSSAGSFSIQNGAALYKAYWTISMVVGHTHFGVHPSLQFLSDNRSSIGLGTQRSCGVDATGYSCPDGNKELDRGSCSQETLFGEDRYLCSESRGCPFVVAEHRGPRRGDVWCRVTRLSNDAAHLCKDDPTKFCHVITVKVGPVNGTYLRVDENEIDRNARPVPIEQTAIFGGDIPSLNTENMREVSSTQMPNTACPAPRTAHQFASSETTLARKLATRPAPFLVPRLPSSLLSSSLVPKKRTKLMFLLAV